MLNPEYMAESQQELTRNFGDYLLVKSVKYIFEYTDEIGAGERSVWFAERLNRAVRK